VRTRSGGHTLAEMLIAVALLGIMMGAIIYLYLTGARAVSQGDVRSDLLRGLQVTSQALTREIETSCYGGLSVAPAGLAVLGAAPPEGGSPTLASNGNVQWRKYVVFWLDAAGRSVRRREYPIPPTGTAQPIELWGSQPFASFAQQGSVVAHDMVGFQASVTPGTQLLRTSLKAERVFRNEPKSLTLEVAVRLKN
jgi:type II secretory pathway pseudopilin PulG